jgi:glutaredoxin
MRMIQDKSLGTAVGIIGLIGAVALGMAASAQAQQMYRWVDKDGRVTYSQTPPPAGAAKNVQQRSATPSVVGGGNLPYAAQQAVKNFPVTLYTAPDCGDACNGGRDLLTKRGIPHREVVVGNEESLASLKSLTGKTQVPVLQVGRQTSMGFNAGEWTSALNAAGYPSSIPPSARPAASVQRNLPAIKLYSAAQCGAACDDARSLLTARGIKFEEFRAQSEQEMDELKKVAGEDGIIPVLLIGGSTIRGFDVTRYHASLDQAGFPRTPASAR